MLLVFGPRSTDYDFGAGHPLTPRRFGPGIGLLEAVGAVPGLAPEPATDDELRWCHAPRYLEAVKAFSRDPMGGPTAGIAEGGDVPPFAGMHEAGAMVAGGSLRAVEAILRGDVEHAYHPGGGLHHAMRDRAAGFCIYDDPALAIARARRDGLRVLYVDLDVHHGDGVQALHADDPGVLTVSFHESGRYLFPGTGFATELGEGSAAGTIVNVPLEPACGERPWLAAVERLVPALAAAFGPDLVVSQHGADSHVWDPLAHLRVTTTAMGAAARLVDRVAHRYARGRWLATGGGGYDAYRVVPRAWALTWLAGAHRETPDATPESWRARWADEAARYGQAPLPATFGDPPNAGMPVDGAQRAAEARSMETAAAVRAVVVPALLRAAEERGWWSADGGAGAVGVNGGSAAFTRGSVPRGTATIEPLVTAEMLERMLLEARVVAPADPLEARALLSAALRSGEAGGSVALTVALAGGRVVGAAVSAATTEAGARRTREVLALGVAPGLRGDGLGAALLRAHLGSFPADVRWRATATVAERDPVEPFPGSTRAAISRRLLEGAGFTVRAASGAIGRIDPSAVVATREPGAG